MSLKQRKHSIPRLPLDRLSGHDQHITEYDFGEATRRTVASKDVITLQHWIETLYRYKQALMEEPSYYRVYIIKEALCFPQDFHNLDVYAHCLSCAYRSLQLECARLEELRNETAATIQQFDCYAAADYIDYFVKACGEYAQLLHKVEQFARNTFRQKEYELMHRYIKECVSSNKELLSRVDCTQLLGTDFDYYLAEKACRVAARLTMEVGQIRALFRGY